MVDPIELDPEDGDNLFDQMEKAMLRGFLANKFPPQLSHDFCCLRLHWAHAWGLMHCIVNGKPGVAIIRRGKDDDHANIFAVITNDTMKIESFTGEVMDAEFDVKLTKIADMPTKQ